MYDTFPTPEMPCWSLWYLKNADWSAAFKYFISYEVNSAFMVSKAMPLYKIEMLVKGPVYVLY